MVDVQIKRVRDAATIPQRASDGASGYDLYAYTNHRAGGNVTLHPNNGVIIDTGIAVAVPRCHELQIRSRSGLAAKKAIFVINSPGTIDSDYRGEIRVILYNLGQMPHTILHGDRIAQLVLQSVPEMDVIVTDSLDITNRGAGGFGSTGD